MIVAPGVRAKQHDPRDVVAERRQHALAKADDHGILGAIVPMGNA
jgi:hypothetical protein